MPDQAGRGLGEILPACMAYILAMRRRDFRRGPGPSKAYGERMTWICFPCSCRRGREILPDIQTNARRKRFLGTKRGGPAECSDHPAAVMAMQEIWHVFGPPSMPEGGPRRTRRLRHGLSQNTERPCSNTCKGFRLHEILPPDVLRHGRSQAVVRRRRGGGQYAVLLPFANTLRFSNERPFCLRGSLALVDKLVMNSIFNVNSFFF